MSGGVNDVWYIFNASTRAVIFGSSSHEPNLPQGHPELQLRRFDRMLTEQEQITELNRLLMQRGEATITEQNEDEQLAVRNAKFDELHTTWRMFQKRGAGNSIRAFAKQVLKCHHDTASRLINADPTIEDEVLDRVHRSTTEWLATL